jgi:hypothetical protein
LNIRLLSDEELLGVRFGKCSRIETEPALTSVESGIIFRQDSGFRQPEVGIVAAIDTPVALNKNCQTDTAKLLIHEFRNCVHQINMELDLAERGLEEKFKYADLISAVDYMTRSLEDLRVRLARTRERRRDKNL